MKPYVWTHSDIDGNGQEFIGIMLEEPKVGAHDLWEGGRKLNFIVNHAKQRTECWTGTFVRGCPADAREIKVWGQEVLAESECLKFAEEYEKRRRN